jgi:hypothetical protein
VLSTLHAYSYTQELVLACFEAECLLAAAAVCDASGADVACWLRRYGSDPLVDSICNCLKIQPKAQKAAAASLAASIEVGRSQSHCPRYSSGCLHASVCML